MPEVFNFSAVDLMAAADDREVPKLMYTRAEASYSLGISRRSLDWCIKHRQIAVRKFGRRVLVPYESLLKFSKSDHDSLTQHPDEAKVQ
jgi:hypothetical protein